MIAGTEGQDEVIQTNKKSPKRKWLALTAITVILGYLAWPAISQWHSAIPTIDKQSLKLAQVTRGDLIRDVAVSGKVVAANAPQLYSSEQGQITLLAKPGESVEQGQVIAQINSPELEAEIKQQSSTLDQLKIESQRGDLLDKEAQLELEKNMNDALSKLNVAKREKQRGDLSYEKRVMSEVDWLKTKDQLADAELFYLHAKKRVDLAEEKLDFERKHRAFLVQREQLILDELRRRQEALSVTAPVSGVVGNWLVAQKNTVAANTPIMTVVDLSKYEAELRVPEFYAEDLGMGLTVAMTIAGEKVSGEIVAISPEIVNNQVQVTAKFTESSVNKFRQNQRINARIEFEKKQQVLMIKRGAFLASLGGEFAYKLDNNQMANKTAIQTGSISVDFVEVISGVQEGDQLIISDYEDFRHADAIVLD